MSTKNYADVYKYVPIKYLYDFIEENPALYPILNEIDSGYAKAMLTKYLKNNKGFSLFRTAKQTNHLGCIFKLKPIRRV